jgi:transposase
MDARQIKARELAERGRVVRQGDHWLVFSLSSPNKYRVTLDPPACTCLDFDVRQEPCKHILAVREALAEGRDDKSPGWAKGPKEEPARSPRKTYPQDWPAYDAAQTNEKAELMTLLADLCGCIQEPERKPGKGRPPAKVADLAFAACFKVYSTFSGRRFMTDLNDAKDRGCVTGAVSHSTVARFFESEEATPVLRNLIAWSALPLASLESVFAPDATGFSACRFDRWYDAKYGRMHQEHAWVKAHIMTGVLTNVVTAVEIHGKDANDGPILPALVKETAVGFKIVEVPADKAYGTLDNYDAIAAVGATPYIAFRRGTNGAAGGLWAEMYHRFCLQKDEFLRHYHQRSNVESTFSAVKRKFGGSVRSKGDVSMKNEVLAKFVCHNVCCLIQSAYEFGVELVFATGTEDVSKMILKFPL